MILIIRSWRVFIATKIDVFGIVLIKYLQQKITSKQLCLFIND